MWRPVEAVCGPVEAVCGDPLLPVGDLKITSELQCLCWSVIRRPAPSHPSIPLLFPAWFLSSLTWDDMLRSFFLPGCLLRGHPSLSVRRWRQGLLDGGPTTQSLNEGDRVPKRCLMENWGDWRLSGTTYFGLLFGRKFEIGLQIG